MRHPLVWEAGPYWDRGYREWTTRDGAFHYTLCFSEHCFQHEGSWYPGLWVYKIHTVSDHLELAIREDFTSREAGLAREIWIKEHLDVLLMEHTL